MNHNTESECKCMVGIRQTQTVLPKLTNNSGERIIDLLRGELLRAGMNLDLDQIMLGSDFDQSGASDSPEKLLPELLPYFCVLAYNPWSEVWSAQGLLWPFRVADDLLAVTWNESASESDTIAAFVMVLGTAEKTLRDAPRHGKCATIGGEFTSDTSGDHDLPIEIAPGDSTNQNTLRAITR